MIKTKTLPNGLRVMLKEMHTAPLASIAIYYKVGSRNEHVGITGISHWVEHMMFKGTPAFSEDEQDRLISREGGSRNAFTWIDFTTYYATVPSSQIDLVLKMEADRMANSKFDPKEVKSERTVIINERQGGENSPTFRLAEEVAAAAFRVHPYGHMVIGHQADLERITRDDLYAHYRHFYTPDNAILCAAG
ncbi:MAG TPA: pitrilysin family protein, partial [Thermoflexales bacterium]|nr:pitrilysin family protein [Thermoflexales bacterium]